MVETLIGTWLTVSLIIGFIFGLSGYSKNIPLNKSINIICAIAFWPITIIALLVGSTIAASIDTGEWVRKKL